MTNRAQALQLLQEKEKLLLQVEQQSEQMLNMHVDELAAAVNNRQRLLQQVQEKDRQLRQLCEEDQPLRDALNQTVVPGDDELQRLYRASMAVKAAANRILQGEGSIERHMQAERERLKGKIEKLNRGSASAAKRYRKAMETGHTPMYQKKSHNF